MEIYPFLSAIFFFGDIRDYYELNRWWDLVLHGTSAPLIGVVGFIAIYSFATIRGQCRSKASTE